MTSISIKGRRWLFFCKYARVARMLVMIWIPLWYSWSSIPGEASAFLLLPLPAIDIKPISCSCCAKAVLLVVLVLVKTRTLKLLPAAAPVVDPASNLWTASTAPGIAVFPTRAVFLLSPIGHHVYDVSVLSWDEWCRETRWLIYQSKWLCWWTMKQFFIPPSELHIRTCLLL